MGVKNFIVGGKTLGGASGGQIKEAI